MRLMADMSLAADRPLNWNLLGSLASEEIYEQQLRASDLAEAAGAHVVALTLPDMMRMRASTLLPGLPGWRAGHRARSRVAPGGHRRPRDPPAAAGRGRAGGPAIHGGAVRLRPHGGGRSRLGLGGPLGGRDRAGPGHRRDRRAHRRGAGRRADPVRRPALADPVAGSDRRGVGGPHRGVEGPTGHARRVGRRCPPRPHVPRQLPDRGPRRGGPRSRTAVPGGGGGDDDRPPGPPLRADRTGPDRRGCPCRPGGVRPRPGGESAGGPAP